MTDPETNKQEGKKKELGAPVDKPKRPSLQDVSRSIFLDAVQKPRVVTCPQGVVAYSLSPNPGGSEILIRLFDPESIDQKIRDILATNADIDLVQDRQIQTALGITVLSHKKSKPSSLPPGDDIFW
jgi:hypothetical protein